MKYLILITFFLHSLHADIKEDIYNLYQNKNYIEACKLGLSQLNSNKRDETYVSIYAFSCLKADYIDRLSLAITYLKNSTESRNNAAYLSIILMQKNLLYNSLLDNSVIEGLVLPTTDHVLSKVFDLYQKEPTHLKHSLYILHDENNAKLSYKLYILKKDNINKMIIESYYDTIMTSRHIFR